jgi:hypothetical protein
MPWAVPAIAIAILCFAAVSRRLEGTVVTAPIVFTAAGLLLGSKALDVIHADLDPEAVKLLAEATLAVVLFGDAARIDLRALLRERGLPTRLLAVGLPLTIAAGVAVALLLSTSMDWPEALLLAVVLAPTDAALGQSVVTLPSLPSRVRQGLNVEIGLNDGLCVPIFAVALAVASTEADFTTGVHAVRLLAEQIGYGCSSGVLPAVSRPVSASSRARAASSRRPGYRSFRSPEPRSPTARRRPWAGRGSSPRLSEGWSSVGSGGGSGTRSGTWSSSLGRSLRRPRSSSSARCCWSRLSAGSRGPSPGMRCSA